MGTKVSDRNFSGPLIAGPCHTAHVPGLEIRSGPVPKAIVLQLGGQLNGTFAECVHSGSFVRRVRMREIRWHRRRREGILDDDVMLRGGLREGRER